MFHAAAAAATTDLIYDLPLLSNSNDLDVEKEEFFNAVSQFTRRARDSKGSSNNPMWQFRKSGKTPYISGGIKGYDRNVALVALCPYRVNRYMYTSINLILTVYAN